MTTPRSCAAAPSPTKSVPPPALIPKQPKPLNAQADSNRSGVQRPNSSHAHHSDGGQLPAPHGVTGAKGFEVNPPDAGIARPGVPAGYRPSIERLPVRKIRAVPPLLVSGQTDPGSIRALMEFLDFAPRYQSLARDLARRFASSYGAGNMDDDARQAEYTERFFGWLARKVTPPGMRTASARKSLSPSSSDLRIIGLLDRYRAGGGPQSSQDCPLKHAAGSPQS